MSNLAQLFPDPKVLLAMDPEELGPIQFEVLRPTVLHSTSGFAISLLWRQFPSANPIDAQVELVLAEALSWLERIGLVMRDPQNSHLWQLTRRGRQMQTSANVRAYADAIDLPPGLVHPVVLDKSQASFLRGDHDLAVLAAFKAVEVAVRAACRYRKGELGVPLMRRAFNRDTGPLTDKKQEVGERNAMQDLFAGAIGAAKNPASHLDVEMDRFEAARLIVFASYLMSIVDARAAALSGGAEA
jgi:uncharacterized protein (TIGR02391 family)